MLMLSIDFQVLNNTKELKQKLKDYMRKQSDLFKDCSFATNKVCHVNVLLWELPISFLILYWVLILFRHLS